MIYSNKTLKIFIFLFSMTAMANDITYVPAHHPLLQQISKKIPVKEILTEKNQKIIDDIMKFALDERKAKKMVGLAAPQLGIPLQIILVDMKISPPEQPNFSTPP